MPRDPVIAVCTYRRPELLERGLRSALAAGDDDQVKAGGPEADGPEADGRKAERGAAGGRRADGSPTFVVLDDDPEALGRDSPSRQVVDRLNRETGSRFRYLGPEGKEAVASCLEGPLAREGVAASLVRFALSGLPGRIPGPVRANRNALFLLAAGGRGVGLDEDLLWELAGPAPSCPRSPDPAPSGPAAAQPNGIRFHSSGDPTRSRPAPERDALEALYPLTAGSPLSFLLAPLGWRPEWDPDSGWATGPPGIPPGLPGENPGLEEASALLRERLTAGELRVAVTSLPVWGHTGNRSAHPLLLLPERSEQAWEEDEELYQRLRVSPWEYRAPDRLTLSDSGFFQHAAAGYDLSVPLPPVFPHLPRNQDGVQGALIGMARPGDLICHSDRGIRHEGPLTRTFGEEDVWSGAVRWGLAEVVLLLLTPLRFPRELGERERWAGLAATLREAGEEGEAGLLDRLEGLRRGYLEGHVRRLDILYDRMGAYPPWWARDVERSIETLEAEIARAEPPPPQDLSAGWNTARELLRLYGELLEAWPVIHEVAAARTEELDLVTERATG